jgi:hypothetical protein
LKEPIRNSIEPNLKPQTQQNHWYKAPPQWLLNLETAISFKDMRRMKSEQWMQRLDQLEYSFETNNTKEAFALSK